MWRKDRTKHDERRIIRGDDRKRDRAHKYKKAKARRKEKDRVCERRGQRGKSESAN